MIDKLFLEKISLAGIARSNGVSPRWLQYYVQKKISISSSICECHIIKNSFIKKKCDNICFFVSRYCNKQLILLGIHRSYNFFLGCLLAAYMSCDLNNHGIIYPLFTVNLLLFTQIFCKHYRPFLDQKTQLCSQKQLFNKFI